MTRSLPPVPAVPHREGLLSGFFRRIRWSFGLIRLADLAHKTDAELIGLAEDYVRRNKPNRALSVLNAFTQRTTLDPRVLQRYGDVSHAIGAHDSAIFSYLQAAELHVQGGMSSKASAVLLQLVRMYPEHVDARISLARVLESLQRNKEAAANYAVVARIFEMHGQHEACAPLLAKIAELWPMARADYQGPPQLPPATTAAPVVVGQPSHTIDSTGPIELDLQSLISAYALDVPEEIHKAPTVAIGTYDPNLLAAAGQVPSTVLAAEDPWLGGRPAIEAAPAPRFRAGGAAEHPQFREGGDVPTASYAAVDVDRTLMDMRGIEIDTARDHPTTDATIMDLQAIRDEGASRVFDLSETARDEDLTGPTAAPVRRSPTLKRTTF